jgi:hypothetical protein
MEYQGDQIIFTHLDELKETLYCECGNPFNRDKGKCPKCKKIWYYYLKQYGQARK